MVLKQSQKCPCVTFTKFMCLFQIASLLASYTSQEADFDQGFFSIHKSGEEFTVHPLRDYPDLRAAAADTVSCCYFPVEYLITKFSVHVLHYIQ